MSGSAHFLMVTHGTAGDVGQFVRLGGGLRGRGHDVVLLSHAPYAAPAARAGIDFVPIDSAAEYQAHLYDTPHLLDLRTPDNLRSFYERGQLFEQLRFEVRTLLDRHEPGRTVLLGRHGSAFSVLIAAELLSAPAVWVALYPSQLMIAPIADYYAQHGLGDQLNALRAEFGLPPVTDWPRWLNSARLTLGLWPRWFDAAGASAPPYAQVTGFIAGDDEIEAPVPPEIAELLAGPVAPVLVTGGTGRMLHRDFYPVAVAAAASVGRPVVVVTPYRDLVADPLPAGVVWVSRLPFATVLPAAGAIVHHGGIGTAMRALRCGTPQVILPHGLDRPDNAQRLAEHGLAEWAPPAAWTVAVVSDQIRQALADEKYGRRAVTRVAGDDTVDAVTAAATLLEDLLGGENHS